MNFLFGGVGMSTRYLFRLDDITWDMDYEKFEYWRDLFFHYGIKPLIGVIPHNMDAKLIDYANKSSKRISEEEFWKEVYQLQSEKKWSVALHGYDHVYKTAESGIIKVNNRSEFAGVPYDIQVEKIRLGMDVMNAHNIQCDTFMAPAHSFDMNTIKALRQVKIKYITDGHSLYPYYIDDVLLVPQIWSFPKRNIAGVSTFCIHSNTTSLRKLDRFERFIIANRKRIVSWDEIIASSKVYKKPIYKFLNSITAPAIKMERLAVNAVGKIKEWRENSDGI